MIKPHVTFLRRCSVILDMTIVTLMFPVAITLQNQLGFALKMGLFTFLGHFVEWNLLNYAPILIWLLPSWYLVLAQCGAYESFHKRYVLDTIMTIVNASVLVAVISLIGFILTGFKAISYQGYSVRYNIGYSLVLIYPAMSACVLIFCRVLLVALFRLVRTLGYNRRQIIIVGTGPRAIDHYRKIIEHPGWGLEIIGFVTLEKNDLKPKQLADFPILGTLSGIKQVLEMHPADEVFFIVPRKWLDRIEESVMTCDTLGITVHIAIDLFSMKVSKTELSNFHGLPVLSLNAITTNYAALAFKRSFDLLASGLGLILFLPFGLLIALLIKLESKGPVFFVQERSTLNGRTFNMYKFRTMVQNAEEIKKDLLSANELSGPVFKMKKDPRMTSLGKLLRKFSIDEIPQLLNIFLGDMSLVGAPPPHP